MIFSFEYLIYIDKLFLTRLDKYNLCMIRISVLIQTIITINFQKSYCLNREMSNKNGSIHFIGLKRDFSF